MEQIHQVLTVTGQAPGARRQTVAAPATSGGLEARLPGIRWVDVWRWNCGGFGGTRLPIPIVPMLDTLTQVLAKHLRFADVSAVVDLAQAQMRKNPDWSGFAKGERLDRMVNTEIIRHCEEAAEFRAAETTEERRGEIAGAWYELFKVEVECELERTGPERGLTAADLEIVGGRLLDSFFTVESLMEVLSEDSLGIYACDVLGKDEIVRWLEGGTPLAKFLRERGNAQADKDREAGRKRGYRERGLDPSMVRCLEVLNGVINDTTPWPAEMLAMVPVRPETADAGKVAKTVPAPATWEKRRYHRMLLNDLFETVLNPRMGYSPRRGALRAYLENRLIDSRLPDALDKYIRDKQRGGDPAAEVRQEYPLLNAGQIEAFAGFVRALADPASKVGQCWMEAIAWVDAGVAERCRMEREGHLGTKELEVELVRCLNAVMGVRPVIPSGTDLSGETGDLAALRTFLAVAPRVYGMEGAGLAMFNRRTLELAYRGWIPEPPALSWDGEDDRGEEEEGGAADEGVPGRLSDAYCRAVLDLLLLKRIPPDSMGRATWTGLSWYGAVGGRKIEGIVDELGRWLLAEHHEALRAWEKLEAEGGKDDRDREAQQAAVKKGEALLERVADSTLREVVVQLDKTAERKVAGLGGKRLRALLEATVDSVEIGHMERVEAELKRAKGGRGAPDASGVLKWGLARVRLQRAKARMLVHEGERKAFEKHAGRWVRSQEDVGRYLGRNQSTIQRMLRKEVGGKNLLDLATGFAELRLRGYRFENEDADPVGPGRGTPGRAKQPE